MANPEAVIIASVNKNRAHLLERSLRTWDNAIKQSGLNVEVAVFSEGWDATHIVNEALHYDAGFITAHGEPSGSHIFGYNFMLDRCTAEKYIFTHGEMLFSSTAIRAAYDAATKDRFVSFKIAWLGEFTTYNLENYDWFPPEKIEALQALYDDDPKTKSQFYLNTDVRAPKAWETTATWCMEHETLQKLRPFPDFKSWGADDLYFATARKQLGIDTYTLDDPILFHQNHERENGGTWEEITGRAVKALNQRFGIWEGA